MNILKSMTDEDGKLFNKKQGLHYQPTTFKQKMVKFDRDFEDMDILNLITYEVGKIFKTIDDFQKIYLLVHSVKKN